MAEAAAQDINYKLAERLGFLNRGAAAVPLNLLQQPDRLHTWLKERGELQSQFSLGMMIADTKGTILTDFPTVPGRAGKSLSNS